MKSFLTCLIVLFLFGCGLSRQELAQIAHERNKNAAVLCESFGHPIGSADFSQCRHQMVQLDEKRDRQKSQDNKTDWRDFRGALDSLSRSIQMNTLSKSQR